MRVYNSKIRNFLRKENSSELREKSSNKKEGLIESEAKPNAEKKDPNQPLSALSYKDPKLNESERKKKTEREIGEGEGEVSDRKR